MISAISYKEGHELYMQRCLQLALLGEYYVAPNPMVGAVLVYHDQARGDVVVGEGWHHRFGQAHAEVNCIMDAERRNKIIEREDAFYHNCTLYINLEPCSHYGKTPPCAELIIKKHISHVVVGMLDPNPLVAGKGVRMLQQSGIDVQVGVLEAQCRFLNRRFVCLHEKNRPYVILKWAQTLDGYIDVQRSYDDDCVPLVISNMQTKQMVHKMRAENMAIMVGTNTVLLDNPKLTTTRWSGRNPIRVTLDRHHVLDKTYHIFSDQAETIVYDDDTTFPHILNDLAQRKVHSILVEGGTKLLNHIISTGLYDEVHVEVGNMNLITPHKPNLYGVKAPLFPQMLQYKMTVEGNKLYELIR